MVKLDIISDPICPWCYIGKTYLEQAIAAEGYDPFDIEWHPFQLNPDMPVGGMDRRAYLEAKFGGKEGAVKAYMPVVEHALDAGLEINFEAIKRTPNTLKAHRLIYWAGVEGLQTATVDGLFRAYFVDGRDIENDEVLGDIADSAGLDASVILKLLQSDVDLDHIQQKEAAFREMGITSVPTFIVGGQHAVPGAQPAKLWQNVIQELRVSSI
jgi:predicted DsbA family dithiol-disulfide isomerase